MNSMDSTPHIAPDVRAAIGAFLNACQKEASPVAIEEAIGAVRRIFPNLDVADAVLADAIASEASTAGFDVLADPVSAAKTLKRKSLERWDNEGGAVARVARTEKQRKIDNDTSGARRRTKETKDRNDLI